MHIVKQCLSNTVQLKAINPVYVQFKTNYSLGIQLESSYAADSSARVKLPCKYIQTSQSPLVYLLMCLH